MSTQPASRLQPLAQPRSLPRFLHQQELLNYLDRCHTNSHRVGVRCAFYWRLKGLLTREKHLCDFKGVRISQRYQILSLASKTLATGASNSKSIYLFFILFIRSSLREIVMLYHRQMDDLAPPSPLHLSRHQRKSIHLPNSVLDPQKVESCIKSIFLECSTSLNLCTPLRIYFSFSVCS